MSETPAAPETASKVLPFIKNGKVVGLDDKQVWYLLDGEWRLGKHLGWFTEGKKFLIGIWQEDMNLMLPIEHVRCQRDERDDLLEQAYSLLEDLLWDGVQDVVSRSTLRETYDFVKQHKDRLFTLDPVFWTWERP